MVVFITIIGLFMWVFPGDLNIFEGGYANIDTLFIIAPWVFMLVQVLQVLLAPVPGEATGFIGGDLFGLAHVVEAARPRPVDAAGHRLHRVELDRVQGIAPVEIGADGEVEIDIAREMIESIKVDHVELPRIYSLSIFPPNFV